MRLRITGVRLPLDHGDDALHRSAARTLQVEPGDITGLTIRRRGYDARKRDRLYFVYSVDVDVTDGASPKIGGAVSPAPDETHRYPICAAQPADPRPVVIGTGPCGIFAALALAEMGLPPLVLERGKAVKERTADVWDFWREGRLDPESNVQFGEGGAGTFSDGKLYTRVKDRGHHGKRVLATLVQAGAPPEITWISKPHVGTLRLVSVVKSLRERIIELGGEVRFGARVTDLELRDSAVAAVHVGDQRIPATHVVLAVGHSARDTFAMLHERGVPMEAKPFSIGFRIEHPQKDIDAARLGPHAGHPELGAADYKLVHHCESGRTVYSFCMCPGGQVVAATSEEGRVVTNGMSHYSRAERNANSGIVVSMEPADFGSDSPLAGIDLQRDLERRAFELGGSTYAAPAQRVDDFLAGRPSTSLGDVVPSYTPGVVPADLSGALPAFAIEALREALPALEKQLPGFARPDAVLTGVETRTSSPLRIPRGEDRQSVGVRGLYPAGEGAGYAGGILSAAMDGMKSAEALAVDLVG